MLNDLSQLTTEQINEKSLEVDLMDSLSIIELMNKEDQKVALAVNKKLPEVAKSVNIIVEQMKRNGRLIYAGAGTSGRLGVLDASECPPTFGTPKEQVTYIMAGGTKALLDAIEDAEDNETAGKDDLKALELTENDVVVAISASGRTPYCIGALKYAKEVGTPTISLSCNQNSLMSNEADVAIEVEVGPEVLTGSTRLKAGTAQKMVLNMLSTASMILLGKTYQNLMVDMRPTNKKLEERAKKIVITATDVTEEVAELALQETGWHVKTAIIYILTGSSADKAKQMLEQADGFVRKAIKTYQEQ